jgi:hypothetical protein
MSRTTCFLLCYVIVTFSYFEPFLLLLFWIVQFLSFSVVLPNILHSFSAALLAQLDARPDHLTVSTASTPAVSPELSHWLIYLTLISLSSPPIHPSIINK